MSKTHIWAESGVKVGDVVKLVDELSPDERLAVNKIRELGDTKILSSKAELLEELAASARAKANASKLLDVYPHLDVEAPLEKPSWAVAAVTLNILVLVGVIAIASHFMREQRPTLPEKRLSEAALRAGEWPPDPREGRGRVEGKRHAK
jgi:hypothetical protein